MVQNPNIDAGRSAEDRAGSRLSDRRLHARAAPASSITTTGAAASLKLRAKVATEDMGRDREALIVTELPYQVNKARLIADIAAMVNEKRIEGISDIRDESDRDGMRIVIELKRGEHAEVVLNNLYKHTQMQIELRRDHAVDRQRTAARTRDSRLPEAVHRSPHRCGPAAHRFPVAQSAGARAPLARLPEGAGSPRPRDRVDSRREESERSARGLDGRRRSLDRSLLPTVASGCGCRRVDRGIFDFSERQAQAIIELQLQRLTGMEQQKILDELAEIQRMIAEYLEILGSETKLRAVIIRRTEGSSEELR